MDSKNYLKNVPIFNDLTKADLARLQKICKTQKFKPGALIFGENTLGSYFYIVMSGSVRIFTSSKGKKKTLAYLQSGEFFGEMSLLDAEKRSASSMAQEECRLIMINKKDFRELITRHPSISLQVMKTLSWRLRQADKDIEALAFDNVIGRVAKALIVMSNKYGEDTPYGIRIKIEINQEEIAQMAGTGREMVSRMLSRMKRLNVIHYDKQIITIKNIHKLKEWAH